MALATRAFVQACKAERDALMAAYADPSAKSAVGARLAAAGLTPEQRAEVLAALDLALTDTVYALMIGLAGAASLGGTQQDYRLADEDGQPISPAGDDDLESVAFEVFHGEG